MRENKIEGGGWSQPMPPNLFIPIQIFSYVSSFKI